MNPSPESENLAMFKEAVEHIGFYRLFPAHVTNNELKDMDISLYVQKTKIQLVHTSAIKSTDPEYAVFAKSNGG